MYGLFTTLSLHACLPTGANLPQTATRGETKANRSIINPWLAPLSFVGNSFTSIREPRSLACLLVCLSTFPASRKTPHTLSLTGDDRGGGWSLPRPHHQQTPRHQTRRGEAVAGVGFFTVKKDDILS
ncbi:hypothetical protein LZ31DRAFT_99184 [Colletotrichum somersetense]|nr:hypothetical protein LZ31DRAFT_99184 [Colletotrichum somersetense]